MIDQLTIQRILDAANIVDVVSEFVTLRRRGANFVGLCPFHNERTPSFSVSPSRGICKCFSCGKGGNAIHFLMEHEQMSFSEAARWLGNKYGIPVEQRELTDREKAIQSERESMFIANAFAAKWFQDKLRNTPKGVAIGMAYFRKRGFRDDVIEKFQLGYCPDDGESLAREAQAQGYSADILTKTGLCYRKEDGTLRDRFWGRVIFPVLSLSGKNVAFGGRIMQSDAKAAKYVNSPESAIYSKSNELYGLYQAKRAIVNLKRCFLVEGYADVISMFQSGVENVVASSGTSLTPGQIRLIHRFTDNITVLYDGDKAGIKASVRGIDMLLAEGMNVRVLLLPDGEDPDSFAQSHSATEFQQYLDSHQVDFIRFKTDLLLDEAKGDPIAKAGLIKEITRSISVIQDPIVRSVYITQTSQMLGIAESLIIQDVNRQQREQSQQAAQPQPARHAEDPMETAGSTSQAGTETQAQEAEAAPMSDLDRLREEIRALKRQDLGPIMDRERLLARLITRFGNRPFCMMETDDGNQEISVGQFIVKSLEADGLEFHHPVYRRFVELFAQHGQEPGFDSQKFFMSHPETFVSLTAASLLDEPYQLSSVFKDNKPANDEDRLYDLTRHILADYQMEVVRLELKKTESMMQDPAVLADTARLTEIQKRYQTLLQARSTLSRTLGDRVVNI